MEKSMNKNNSRNVPIGHKCEFKLFLWLHI